MMWILHSLNSTIEHLTVRKQTFKRMMFTKLYRVLVGAVVVIVSCSSVLGSARLRASWGSACRID